MKKKLRGLKRKWCVMLMRLNQLADSENKELDEIFIEASFDHYQRKIAYPYKKELFYELVNILIKKQNLGNGRYYLVWGEPESIFESVILIFESRSQLQRFFISKKLASTESSSGQDTFLLCLDSQEKLVKFPYIPNNLEQNEVLLLAGKFDDVEQLEIPIVVIADERVIEMVKTICM